MPRPASTPLAGFFSELPAKDRELAVLSLDLQPLLLQSKTDEEKQDLLDEAGLVTAVKNLPELGLEEMSMALSSKGASLFPEILADWIAEGQPVGI